MDALEAALHYHALGFSIIPIKPGTKRPGGIRSWQQYREKRADDTKLRAWFAKKRGSGLAVIFGEVSNGLVCRDFDSMEAYSNWSAAFPNMAQTLPTVATARGRHVYCRGVLAQIREASPTGKQIIDFGDGEMRGDGYCVLPPSRHPTGHVYNWLPSLPCSIPQVDLQEAGLLTRWGSATECNREAQRVHRNTEDNGRHIAGVRVGGSGLNDLSEETLQQVRNAVADTLPTGSGRRNKQVFEFARALKAIPVLADADGRCLLPFVREWHSQAKSVIQTQPVEETIVDFLRGWKEVKYPKGAEPMNDILEKAKAAEIPAAALQFDAPETRLLVSLCRELQRTARNGVFYLSCRTAGRLLSIDYTTAWRRLYLLEQLGFLQVVTRGNRKTQKASRYKYLHPLEM